MFQNNNKPFSLFYSKKCTYRESFYFILPVRSVGQLYQFHLRKKQYPSSGCAATQAPSAVSKAGDHRNAPQKPQSSEKQGVYHKTMGDVGISATVAKSTPNLREAQTSHLICPLLVCCDGLSSKPKTHVGKWDNRLMESINISVLDVKLEY